MNFFKRIPKNLADNCKVTTFGTLFLIIGSVIIADSRSPDASMNADTGLYVGVSLMAVGLVMLIYAATKNNQLEEQLPSGYGSAASRSDEVAYVSVATPHVERGPNSSRKSSGGSDPGDPGGDDTLPRLA